MVDNTDIEKLKSETVAAQILDAATDPTQIDEYSIIVSKLSVV